MENLNSNIENQKKTIIQNIGWLTISKIIVSLLSIVTITLIPRYLGVTGYGQLNFALSFVGIFSIIGHLGINILTLRDVSKNKDLAEKYFNNLFVLEVFISLIFLFIISICAILLPKTIIVKKLLILITFGTIFNFLTGIPRKIYNAFQKLKYRAIYESLRKISYVLFVLLFMYLDFGLLGIGLSFMLMSLVGFIFIFINFRKIVNIKFSLDLSFMKKSFIAALPFALSVIFTKIYFYFDRIFISFIKGDYFVGLYAIGYTLYGFLLSFLIIFKQTFFPVVSKYIDTNKIKSVINKFLYIILFFALPLTFGGIYLAKDLISLVFGSMYVPGASAFKLILVFFLISSINIVFITILFNKNYEKYVLKLRIIATISNIVLNIIIIPFLGIVGAALTTILSEFIILIGSYSKISKYILKINILKILSKPLISSIFMIFSIYIFKNIFNLIIFTNKLNVLVYVIIGAIFYLLLILLLGGIKKKYFALIFGSFNFKK